MALTLSQLVNDYGSYSGNTLRGLYGASASVPNRGFGDVRGVPYDNITFIIKVNGTKYASSKWLSQQQNGNPYLSSNTVPRIDSVNVPTPPLNYLDTSGEGEKYAEIKATSKLTNDTAILNYINELLSPSDEVKDAKEWGSWSGNVTRKVTVPTIIQDPLGNPYQIGVVGSKYGNTYNADIDLGGVYPGLEFEETGFDGKVSGEAALAASISVKDEKVPESSIDSGTDVGDILGDIVIPPIDFTGIKINTPTGTFTGVNQNFLLGDADRNTGNADVRSTLRQLSDPTGLDRTGLRDAYDTGDFGPLGAMFEE